jgi:hypothetical protein
LPRHLELFGELLLGNAVPGCQHPRANRLDQRSVDLLNKVGGQPQPWKKQFDLRLECRVWRR